MFRCGGDGGRMTEKPVAIVTGVGPATGSAIVRRFSAGGFLVVALAELGGADQCPRGDASRRSRHHLRRIRRERGTGRRRRGAAALGAPEVLVHNAVGGGWGNFREIDPQMLRGNSEVNVMGFCTGARGGGGHGPARQGQHPGDRQYLVDPRQGQFRRLCADQGRAAHSCPNRSPANSGRPAFTSPTS